MIAVLNIFSWLLNWNLLFQLMYMDHILIVGVHLSRWDVLTAELELVEAIDGHTDIVYGSFDPKYFKRWEVLLHPSSSLWVITEYRPVLQYITLAINFR
jgi:hypothetical protein